MAPRYLVMYSGGLTSYMAARRLVDRHGRDAVQGLFADTKIEDADLYRFVDETIDSLGIKLNRVADGRDPWQVFRDERFIGNSRVDPCSKILKRQLMDRWLDANCDPADTVLVFGLDWSERGRIERHRKRLTGTGWQLEYPLDEKPYLTKNDIIDVLKAEGIAAPRLYALGFPHNNCGGFCVKMGLAQAAHLLVTLPEVYDRNEQEEQRSMAAIGPTAKPFLRYRRGGKTRGVSMKAFREAFERQKTFFGNLDDAGWGCGGGCAIDDEAETLMEADHA